MTQFDKLYTSREKLVKTVLSLTEQVNQGGGGGSSSGIEPRPIQSSELKTLRDSRQLTPGALYRITDYETTTSRYNTQSAGHVFDIIVLALDNKTLSEEAWACHSERDNALQGMKMVTINGSEQQVDTLIRNSYLDGEYEGEVYYGFALASEPPRMGFYIKSLEEEPTSSTLFIFLDSEGIPTTINGPFESVVTLSDFASQHGGSIEITDVKYGYFAFSKLEAWKLWYCLDNDTNRFAWAKNDMNLSILIKQSGPDGWRSPEHDIPESGLYAWVFNDRQTYYAYTFVEYPSIGDYTVFSDGSFEVISTTVEEMVCTNFASENDTYVRDSSLDKYGKYGWRSNSAEPYPDIIYTDVEVPSVGTVLNIYSHPNRIIEDISWNGKGVIYRMIDEFGNDCPYDFKNIQNILPISGWIVDNSGTNKPCYTFDQGSRDYSLTGEASNNVIGSYYEYGLYHIPVVRMGAGEGNRIGVNCNRIYLGAMKGANVCQFVTDVDYQTGGKDSYHHYEWFGRARNGSVVQTNLFGTAT